MKKEYTTPEVKINMFEARETIAADAPTLTISAADTQTYSIDTFTID